jgi:hypothetical protein
VHVSGKLIKEDYEDFVPAFDQLVGLHEKLSVLLDMTGFHGWTVSAAWEDTKFGFHHFGDIDRLAVVGEKNWRKEWPLSVSRLRRQRSNISIIPKFLKLESGCLNYRFSPTSRDALS